MAASACTALLVLAAALGASAAQNSILAAAAGGEQQHRKVIKDYVHSAADEETAGAGAGKKADKLKLPEPTHYGYLDVNTRKGSSMFFMYYEATDPEPDASTTPIVLWLQASA